MAQGSKRSHLGEAVCLYQEPGRAFIAHTFACTQTCARQHGGGGGYLPLSAKRAQWKLSRVSRSLFISRTREMFAYRHHIPKGADEFSPPTLRHRLSCSGVGSRRDSRQWGFLMLHACWREINKELLTTSGDLFSICLHGPRLPLTFPSSRVHRRPSRPEWSWWPDAPRPDGVRTKDLLTHALSPLMPHHRPRPDPESFVFSC